MDRHGIRPDPDAVEAVLTWKSPKTEHQLMSFLGFANYYRDFIKGYADKVYPMQQLMRHKGNKQVHVEQRGGRIIPENKEEVVQSTGARNANGKRNVCAGHGCIGSCDFWHSPSGAGVEREDSHETNIIQE